MVDIDILTKETRVLNFKSDLYIHERHLSDRAPVEEMLLRKSLGLHSASPSSCLTNGQAGGDFVDGPGLSMVNGKSKFDQPDSDALSSNVRNFIISGVVDPKTGKKLSVAKALAKGVLNKEFGLYNNLETGESMPIAEAIARGFITVDYVDPKSSSSVGMVNGNGLHSLTNGSPAEDNMLNSMEIKSFDIAGVVDPQSGEIISATEAIAAGIINLDSGKEL